MTTTTPADMKCRDIVFATGGQRKETYSDKRVLFTSRELTVFHKKRRIVHHNVTPLYRRMGKPRY